MFAFDFVSLLTSPNSRKRAGKTWYMNEAFVNAWSSRQLGRPISTLYYERLLASRNKLPVKAEVNILIKTIEAENFIKDPYVLEFLALNKKITLL